MTTDSVLRERLTWPLYKAGFLIGGMAKVENMSGTRIRFIKERDCANGTLDIFFGGFYGQHILCFLDFFV